MAKKQRRQNKKQKNQKNQTSAQPPLSTTELEHKVHRSIESFAYRPAIKFAKELHQREPDKYQSLLIKALQGLYQELTNKGQAARAATILDQIKNLGESSATDIIELSLALQNGMILPPHEKIAVEKLMKLETEALTDNDKNIIINVLLAATTLDLPQAATEPITQALFANIFAIRNAFKLICAKQYAAAIEEVNGIKRNSLLAPWRMLIKGITAFYLGYDEKALTAFRKLPAKSTPAELANAYLFLLNDTETCRQFAKKELLLQKVSLLAADEEVAKLLSRAEILWNTGRYRDSYTKIEPLLQNIDQADSFLQNRLLRFFYNSSFTMNDDQQHSYIYFLSEKLFSPGNKCPARLHAAYLRNAALYEETCVEGEENAVKLWDSFLEIYNRIQPVNRAFTAAVYAHQASIYAELQELDQDIFSPQKMIAAIMGDPDEPELEPIDPQRAEVLYRRAIKTNPDNLEIRLKLLELFEVQGNKTKAKTNRLLDELIRKFPDNKDILTKTGIRCLERKAFPKGLKYLYQAARLDATDNKIKEYIIIGSINYAWKLTLASNQKRCSELLAETLTFCVAQGQHLTLSPAMLRARWAVFALFHDQVEEGKQELATALTADNSLDPDEVLYFFRLYAGVHNIPKAYLKGSENELNKVFRRIDNLDRLITFTKIILYTNQVSENDTFIKKELSRLIKALKKLTKKITSPKQCLTVVEFAQSHLVDNQKMALAFLRQGQRKFPDDLEIRLIRLSLEMENSRSIPTYKQMDQLNDLIEQAKTTENHKIARKAVELVEHFERKINWHRSFNNFEDLYGNDDDEDYETEDFDDEVVDEFFDSLAERLPPGANKPPKNWPRRRTRK